MGLHEGRYTLMLRLSRVLVSTKITERQLNIGTETSYCIFGAASSPWSIRYQCLSTSSVPQTRSHHPIVANNKSKSHQRTQKFERRGCISEALPTIRSYPDSPFLALLHGVERRAKSITSHGYELEKKQNP